MPTGRLRPLGRRSRSCFAGAVIAVVVILGPGGTAFADPAGPTDYRSEILAIDPATPTIQIEVLGGDSFVELTTNPGTEVFVTGYRGEPYLWFHPDGTVLENRNSPTTYQNEDRYGGESPPFATPDAEPEWQEIGRDGRWAWHDHRAHWMQSIRPAGKGPGDRVVEAVIPLLVDGQTVDVTVISTWQPAASTVPIWIGSTAAASAALAGWMLWRRGQAWVAVVVPIAGLAFVAGAWQYWSLPAETGPRLVWLVLPTLAVIAAAGALIARLRTADFFSTAAALLAGAQLATWGFIKRAGLTAAIVPTGAPGWLDRLATVSALVGGVSIVALALWQFFGPRRELTSMH